MQHLFNLFRFLKYTFLFLFFNRENNESSLSNKNFIIVISPWNFSATPFFFIKLGNLLKEKNQKVIYLFDNIPYSISHRINIFILKFVFSFLKISYKNIYDSSKINNNILNANEYNLFLNISYENYISTTRGYFNIKDFLKYKISFEYYSPIVIDSINEIIIEYPNFNFIIPGGSFGSSSLFTLLMKKNNTNYFTIDSGFSIISNCFKGIASKNQNINEQNFTTYKKHFSEKEIVYVSDLILQNRKFNTNINLDHEKFQINKFTGKEHFKDYFVLYLNTIWDSAAFVEGFLNLNYQESIKKVVEIFLKSCSNTLIIRIHPHERNWWGKSNFNYKNLLNEFHLHFGERLIFIEPENDINSYDLLIRSNGNIIWSSTIGLESIILKKPTIFISNSYITSINSIQSHLISNTEEIILFFTQSDKYVCNDLSNLDARLIYILTQKFTWLKTLFTPQAIDFLNWVKLQNNILLEDESVKMLLNSLINENNLTLECIKIKQESYL
jgi:hypothetical protein